MTTNIRVIVGANRFEPCALELRDGAGVLIRRYHCVARADRAGAQAHGNPAASPLLPYGDTPTGGYTVSGPMQTGTPDHPVGRYGPNGFMRLAPVSGDAMLARENGREGLLIHGGHLDARGRMRPTNGCVRLHDDDMADLVALVWIHQPSACEAEAGPVGVVEPGRRREFDPDGQETAPAMDPPVLGDAAILRPLP
jgi:hypothetical protein